MTSTVLFGVGLGLLSSILFNISYLVQHKALDGGPSVDATHPLRSLGELFRAPAWLWGGLLGLIGTVIYTLALNYAPLSLVQAFLAGGLILTVPLAMFISNHKPTRREVIGAGLMAGALILFAFGTAVDGPENAFDVGGLALLVGGTLLLTMALTVVGFRQKRVEAIGLAAGLLHGASDAMFNALVGIAHNGLIALLKSPWTWICAVTSLGAFYLLQKAFKDGTTKPVVVIALMTAATNLTAIGAGLLVFDDPLGTNTFWSAVHLAAFGLVAYAGWLLASVQAVIEKGKA
ncbi:MAG: DMT family transporter [Solirubrobacterales bacterium]|nr:DMT family transporter [Solirubrobacterales bacterium]